MRVWETDLKEFLLAIEGSRRKIVIYGMGVIGRVTLPTWIEDHRLEESVLFIADADSHKWGTFLQIGNRKIEICPPEQMEECKEDFVILVTASRYETVLQYLESVERLSEIDVYIFPQMLAKECKAFKKQKIERIFRESMIPKVIHCCWFGGGEMSDGLKRCRESWSRFCPEYKIVEWNEDNYDIQKYEYTKQAWQHRRWGFIPDIARLDILYQHGGIYLDTDVELIQSLDELLYQRGFVGVEKWGIINIGGGCGVVPKHPMIKKILEYRLRFPFEREDGSINLESSGRYESVPLMDCGFKPNNTIQSAGGMTIYTSDFFHPYDYMSRELCITENTYGIHHFAGSWVTD